MEIMELEQDLVAVAVALEEQLQQLQDHNMQEAAELVYLQVLQEVP
jgi:hypothetical protein